MDIPIQLANGTSPVIVRTEDPFFSILQIMIPIVATVVIGYFTIRFSLKQNQRNVLISIFKMLNNPVHKKSESTIIYYFRQNALYDGQKIGFHYEKDADTVGRNYDQLGLLVLRRGLIPKKEDVMYMFGTLVVVSHLVLFQEINRVRLSQEKYFMVNFTNLAIDSYNYWKRQGQTPRHPQTNQEIPEDEVKRWKESLPKK